MDDELKAGPLVVGLNAGGGKFAVPVPVVGVKELPTVPGLPVVGVKLPLGVNGCAVERNGVPLPGCVVVGIVPKPLVPLLSPVPDDPVPSAGPLSPLVGGFATRPELGVPCLA